MPGRVGALLLGAAVLIVAAGVGGCSTSAPAASPVEQQASSLAVVASPGQAWSRVEADLFGELLGIATVSLES